MDPLFLSLALLALAATAAYTVYLRRVRKADEISATEGPTAEWQRLASAEELKKSGYTLWRVVHPEGTILTSGDFVYQNERRERIATEMPSGLPRGSTLLIGADRLIVTHVPKDPHKAEILFKAGEGVVAKAKIVRLDRISIFLKAPHFEVQWGDKLLIVAKGDVTESGRLIAKYLNLDFKSLFAANAELSTELRVLLMYLARGVYRG